MNDKMKWWTEFALDVVSTFILGWLLLGGFVAALLGPTGEDPGELAQAIPVVAKVAVTYAVWKLFRTFNWLKGVPPKV